MSNDNGFNLGFGTHINGSVIPNDHLNLTPYGGLTITGLLFDGANVPRFNPTMQLDQDGGFALTSGTYDRYGNVNWNNTFTVGNDGTLQLYGIRNTEGNTPVQLPTFSVDYDGAFTFNGSYYDHVADMVYSSPLLLATRQGEYDFYTTPYDSSTGTFYPNSLMFKIMPDGSMEADSINSSYAPTVRWTMSAGQQIGGIDTAYFNFNWGGTCQTNVGFGGTTAPAYPIDNADITNSASYYA